MTRARRFRFSSMQMKWRLALATLLLGCDDAPAIPPPHPKHDLVIERGSARYNGKLLPLGAPLERWVSVLGPYERVGRLARWGRLGLFAREQLDPNRPAYVSCLLVEFDRPSKWGMAHPFPGRILLDGAPLFPGIELNHINQLKKFACTDFGHAPGFRKSPIPGGGYMCNTDVPPRSYDLDTHGRGHIAYASRLEMCCAHDRECKDG
jgi:hypothetical protein